MLRSNGGTFAWRGYLHSTLLLALGTWCVAAAPADSVVLRVGQTVFTRSEVQTWLQRTPFAKGRTPLLNAARLTEKGRLLLAEGTHDALPDQVLAQALERALRAEQAASDAEIAAFFAEHRERYEEPRAIRIWRILVADEALAKTIIAKVDGQPKAVYLWGDLAREHSLDLATKQRDGSLGFVRDGGSTDVPELHVLAEIFSAADQIKDGQIAPEPVREGSNFAVIWRKGTRPARARTLGQERENIREILVRTRAQAARTALVERLRSDALSDYHPDDVPEIAAATRK